MYSGFHYLNYQRNKRSPLDQRRTMPPIISCPKSIRLNDNANPAEQPYIRPSMRRPAFARQIKPGGRLVKPISTGTASGGNVQGYSDASTGPTVLVASFESMSGTNMTGTGFVSTNSNTENEVIPIGSGGTVLGTGAMTSGDFGNISVNENLISITDFNSIGNIYIESVSTDSYISIFDDMFIGIEKKLMDYTIGYLAGSSTTSTNINTVITNRISSIVSIGYDDYLGSKFTVFGNGTVDPAEVSKGLYWTSTGTNRNTLTIQGNLSVQKGTAIVRVDRLITSNPVYGINVQPVGPIIPTTGDVGMEMAWNTSLIEQFDIQTITAYTAIKALIVTTSPNNYTAGDEVYIGDSNSEPSINGIWTIIDIIDASSFTINKTITVAGNSGIVSVSFEIAFIGYDVTTQRLKYISNVESSAGGIYTATHYGKFEIGGLYLTNDLFIGNTPFVKTYLSTSDLIIENNNNSKNITMKANDGTSTQTILDMNESSLSAQLKAININQKMSIYTDNSDVVLDLLNSTDDFNINVTNSSTVKNLIKFDGLTGYIGINEITIPHTNLDINGTTRLPDTKYLYLGGTPTTNGTWRIWNDTGNGILVFEKRIAGIWVILMTIHS